jgi:P-type Cu2+ transporter
MNAPLKRTDLEAFVIKDADGLHAMDFAVEGIKCAGCMRTIETSVDKIPGIARARLNLTLKRLHVAWESEAQPDLVMAALKENGFTAHPFDPHGTDIESERESKYLLRCLGVAAFATMNIMLLSVSVWSGNASDITPETRDFFHWLSGLIAIPAVAYAGRPFFKSALSVLKHMRVNMDVPISLGLILSILASIYETFNHAHHAYFDSGVMLCTFLLAGRYLEHQARGKMRATAANLTALKADYAERLNEDGSLTRVAVSMLGVGERVMVTAGGRIPVDGRVLQGISDVDQSLVTGETMPIRVKQGDVIYAGGLNGSGTLTMEVLAADQATFLAEVDRLLERALSSRPKAVMLADKAAKHYAPVVHITALASFLGWLLVGASMHYALMVAIAVLIITCPCALGLAVPAVHVVSTSALFKAGVVLNSGDALERLSEVDYVVFDKTGTLTLPVPSLLEEAVTDEMLLQAAASLAHSSHHPISGALRAARPNAKPLSGAQEVAGHGVEAEMQGIRIRLGHPTWVGLEEEAATLSKRYPEASMIAVRWGDKTAVYPISQSLRPDAQETIAALKKAGLGVEILSGDRKESVVGIAQALGIETWQGNAKPADKIARLEQLKAEGRKVLMVGDGLNDAPALAASHVSLSPVTATQIAQSASDAVFLGDSLAPITAAHQLARKARKLMIENLIFSVAYNAVVVPVAILGYATPLIAAAAMSSSSIIVTLNALRARKP